jgi:hypothetical protein
MKNSNKRMLDLHAQIQIELDSRRGVKNKSEKASIKTFESAGFSRVCRVSANKLNFDCDLI